MNVRRMMGITALAAAATGLVFVPGAGAQEAGPSYGGSSSGEALNLSLFGQGLTVGSTLAELTPTSGTAQGSGVATPAFEAGATSASETAPGSADETCEGPLDQIPGISIALACSSSQVTMGETSTAAATGRVGTITLNPVAPILDTPLSEVVAPVEDGVDQLLGGLEPVLGPIDEASDLGLEDTLGELFDRLFAGADLATVTLGDTASTTTANATNVTTSCVAEGARVDVLSVLDGPPLISVVVGRAGSTVDVDRASGTGTPTVDPALVTIESATLGVTPITVPVGQTVEVPLPEPFGPSYIRVADGTTGTNEDGSTFATANAVSLDLLNGEALMGGIELELAGCTSVAGAEVPVQPAAAAPVPTLPTTGSDDTGMLVLAGLAGLAGLGLALLRRSGTDT
ncbi:MAG TPA: LPXTG cell wall anchor domain-containing protein [Acidimicrobiales bacterium]|nr:LPXTG cell wall anchor domain-containing protein [Acidimicrobiales bacterium]